MPLLGKMLKKIVHELVSHHLETKHLLSDKQFGFRAGLKTGDPLFSLLKDLYEHRDDNQLTMACFVDYTKAFDCVDHPTL